MQKIFFDIWSEYNYTTELKEIIQNQIKNLRKTPIPQLPNFDNVAASVLDVIDWIFKITSFFSQMNILYSEMITLPLPRLYCLDIKDGFVFITNEYILPEMITLPLPFQKNDRSSDLDVKYPHHSAIVIVDNALTHIYLEAISTNKVIITSIPHRFFTMSIYELVQEIEAILLP